MKEKYKQMPIIAITFDRGFQANSICASCNVCFSTSFIGWIGCFLVSVTSTVSCTCSLIENDEK